VSIEWDRIENFIGFGRPDAPVVFLGMEEGLRRDADLLVDLRARSTYEPFMDLGEAQTQLDGPGSYFGPIAITQKTWRPMCDLMLRRDGVQRPTLDERRRYQADRLGRRDGDTLLTELLPYPHSDSEQWLYAQFERYPTRRKFEKSLIPRRRDMLRKLFAEHPPQLIVAHGKANWPEYKEIFGELTWRKDGPFECATWGATRIVLAHQLAGKQFNTDEQLERFARIALPNSPDAPSPAEPDRAMTSPISDDGESSSEVPERRANRNVRKVFGALTRSHRVASGLSAEKVALRATEFAGQGNPGGVRNLEAGRGWVHPGFAEGVFRAVGIPDPEELGRAYADLKLFFRGVTKEQD